MNTPGKTALILIDIQKGFEDIAYWGGQRNNPAAEENMALLLNLWRERQLPIFHIKHCSSNPVSLLRKTHPGNAFMDFSLPQGEEPVIEKNVNSAFIGTSLQQQLCGAGISKLVLAGFTTDHCVSTTARMAGNLGFETFVVADATATFCKKGMQGQLYTAELIHETALASLDKEFATVITTVSLINR